MRVEVVLLPEQLRPGQIAGKTAVVFDVLRATTTMTAALHAGVKEIRVFSSIDEARSAASAQRGEAVLCGEVKCLKPPGFDLGNSPGGFDPPLHRGKIVYMATTNGTKAILAAREAAVRIAGALVNTSAAAQVAAGIGRDVVLLCAGTGGEIAMEDVIGAGAVAEALVKHGAEPRGDTTRIAIRLFDACRAHLADALAESEGGRNVIHAGLAADIQFAAKVDSSDLAGIIEQRGDQTILRKA